MAPCPRCGTECRAGFDQDVVHVVRVWKCPRCGAKAPREEPGSPLARIENVALRPLRKPLVVDVAGEGVIQIELALARPPKGWAWCPGCHRLLGLDGAGRLRAHAPKTLKQRDLRHRGMGRRLQTGRSTPCFMSGQRPDIVRVDVDRLGAYYAQAHPISRPGGG